MTADQLDEVIARATAAEREAWERELAPLIEAGAFEGVDFETCEHCGSLLTVEEVARVEDGPTGCWRYLTGQDRFDCPGDRRKRITEVVRAGAIGGVDAPSDS